MIRVQQKPIGFVRWALLVVRCSRTIKMSQRWQTLARDNEHIQMEKRKNVLEDWHFFRMASINKRKGCRLV